MSAQDTQKTLPQQTHSACTLRLGRFSFTRKTPGMNHQMTRRGLNSINLISEWDKIIGPALARYSVPEGVKNISGKRIVYIKVFETRIIEYQHQKDDILKRINMTAGFHFADDLKLRRVTKIPKSRYKTLPKAIGFPKEEHDFIKNQKRKFNDQSLEKAFSNLAHAVLKKKNQTEHKKVTQKPTQKSWVLEAKKILAP